MKGRIQTQKYGLTVNSVPQNFVILPKNMDDNFILVINWIARNYFWGIA